MVHHADWFETTRQLPYSFLPLQYIYDRESLLVITISCQSLTNNIQCSIQTNVQTGMRNIPLSIVETKTIQLIDTYVIY